MARAGLPTPRNRLIERPDQVEAAGQHVGFPAGEGLKHPGCCLTSHLLHSLSAAGSVSSPVLPFFLHGWLDGWANSLSCGTAASLQSGTDPFWYRVMPHAVIKPIYGAASIGVVKVEDMEGLKATYRRVAKEMAGARIVDGAMQAGAADDDETDQARVAGKMPVWSSSMRVLGPRVQVDLLSQRSSI